MLYALISTSDNSWQAGPLDEAPDPVPDGVRVIALEEDWSTKVYWDPAAGPQGGLRFFGDLISVGRFKLLLTKEERIAVRAAASSDPDVEDFLDLLAGFTDGVALNDPILIAAIQQLVAAGLLTQRRADQILTGTAADGASA